MGRRCFIGINEGHIQIDYTSLSGDSCSASFASEDEALAKLVELSGDERKLTLLNSSSVYHPADYGIPDFDYARFCARLPSMLAA